MQKKCGNIYKTARTTAGLTQERWAEMLGISDSCVRQYEAGGFLPSDDVVARMAEISGMPVLGYWHLKNKSGVANDLLPDVEIKPLAEAVMQLLYELKDFEAKGITDKLIKISMDGKVDKTESRDFSEALKELEDIVEAALAVRYAQREKGG